MTFPPQPSDSLISVSWPCPEGQFPIISAIQAYPSRTFHLSVDSLGLCRNGSSSWIINQAQDFPDQFPRQRHLRQLERDLPARPDAPRTWPEQPLSKQLGREAMLTGRIMLQDAADWAGIFTVKEAEAG